MNQNNFCLLICGPAITQIQLLNDVKNYLKNGVENIVISSYSTYIHKDLHKYCKIIECDKVGKYFVNAPSKYLNKKLKLGYNDHDIIDGIPINSNIFFHLQTTKLAIKKAEMEFPNVKYYVKIRADMYIDKLNICIKRWNRILNKSIIKNGHYSQKLITKKRCRIIKKPWYICDYLIIGNKYDVKKYYFFKKSILKLSKRFSHLNRGAEAIISSGYLLECDPSLDFFKIYHKYFYPDHKIKCRWWKHDVVDNKMKIGYPKFV